VVEAVVTRARWIQKSIEIVKAVLGVEAPAVNVKLTSPVLGEDTTVKGAASCGDTKVSEDHILKIMASHPEESDADGQQE
jgi:hypothetical protein